MPAKRKASAGKKGGNKEPEVGTRRSTRGASTSTDSKSTAGSKRKASPSPSPAPKRAASAKKGRTTSPSPATETRTTRGRSTTTKKEEPKSVAAKPVNKSPSNQKGRVTRNVVQEVEKKATETKSRSSSRGAKTPATPKNSTTAKSKAATPSPKVVTPKKKVETPKQKATPRGRSTTPKQTKATPKKAEVAPKQKPTPKQKPSPKQKQQSPKKKQEPAAKKETTKSPQVKKAKVETPPKTSRSRRSRNTEPAEETEENTQEIKEKPNESSIEDKPIADAKQGIAEEGSNQVAPEKDTEDEVVEKAEDEVQPAEQMETVEKGEIKEEENVDGIEPEKKENSIEKEDTGVEEDQVEKEVEEDINEKSEEKIEDDLEDMETDAKEEETEKMDQLEEVKPDEKVECTENIEETEVKSDEVIECTENIKETEVKSDEVIECTENIKDTVIEVDSQPVENDQAEGNVELRETESPATVHQSKENSVEENAAVTEETCIDLVENDSNDGVEVVSAETEDLSQKVIDLNEDSGEAVVIQEETAPVNDLTNDDVGNGAGDQEPNKKVSPVEEISDDDIEEIETITNNVQGNGAANASAGNDEIEVIDFVNQEDKYVENCPTKRKFDDVENQDVDDTSPHKKVRLSATEEEEIQENGSGAQEDLAKDFVVIEMSDVPASDSAEVQTSLPNPVYNRSFIPNPTFSGSSDNSKQFSLVSYNILADCHLFKNDYSFTESKYLQPEYRLKNVIEELKYLDSDIVCLQEVDPQFFSDQLLPSMKSLGYDGVHKKRDDDYYNEGEATFYKTSRFTIIDTQASTFSQLLQKELEGIDPAIQEAVRKYTDLPDVVIVTKLQCKNTGREVTIGNVHINWGEMKMPDTQCVQIASAVKEIVSKATGDNFPHIICGDFNSPPMSPGYLVAKDGYPSGDETINTLMRIEGLEMPDSKKASLVNSLWPAFQHTSSSLRSAYSEAQGYEPEISSYNRVMCDTVDYIFYSSVSLENAGVLQTASKERVMETGGIPNRFFPSDHISIKAVLSFK